MSRRLLVLLAVAVLALAAAVVAGSLLAFGQGSEATGPTDEEIDRIIERIDELGPFVGMGEASPPPPDVNDWATNFDKALVPLSEFTSGGPPKDGIPALDEPAFETALGVTWLADREPVIAVTVEGETRAYPLQIMTWHEIANDVIQGVPVAVTFCPLCNTAIVFDRRVDGRRLDFGVSGKLRSSDLVMFDRQTESWWQQFEGRALVGDYAGAELRQLPARIISWREFRQTYPESRVLSRETGHRRDYGRNPYTGYDDAKTPPFFAAGSSGDERLAPKERVVFVESGGGSIAVPFTALAEKKVVRTSLGGSQVVVRWRGGVASALDASRIAKGEDVGAASVEVDGRPAVFSEPFWFAVAAFRSDTRIVR
jgi:hypothetical protein